MVLQDKTTIALAVFCSVLILGFLFIGWRFIRQHRLLKQRLLTVLKLEGQDNGPLSEETGRCVTAPPPKKHATPSPIEPINFTQHPASPKINAPEKYRYVSSLANHGMDATEIAEILKISTPEAEQLLKLAKVSGSAGKNR